MKNVFYSTLLICFVITTHSAIAQTVTRTVNPNISGAQCPGIGVDYQVSVPSGFESCQIAWSVTNGIKTVNPTDQSKVSVTWDDTAGATGTITATFSNCTAKKENNGTTASLSETILSVNGQNFEAFPNSVTLDYCGTKQVTINVPHMYVQGTGGIA
jgi:hypothetical protein